ncbi:NUDIX hydrolase [Candidatus Uhrbacteria bacterium]|nr:NUDIX hydrolase [Candidatus Uhrbacteria bacterium]
MSMTLTGKDKSAPAPYCIPISVKGIVFESGKVWLRKNERGEWELPGGKLDEGEQPEETVVREMKEELGFATEVRGIIQAHLYRIARSLDEEHGVLVVIYLCKLISKTGEFELNGEAGSAQFKAFDVSEIDGLNMPEFYKQAIAKAVTVTL